MRRRYVVMLLVGLLATVTIVVAAIVDRDPAVQVAQDHVTAGPIARQVIATGTLEAKKTVDVGTQVSGTVQSLAVDFNSTVRTGQIVARLDPSAYVAQLQEAQGNLAQAQAESTRLRVAADDARVKYQRAQVLAKDQLITQAELDAAQVTLKQAEADLAARQADIKVAQASVRQAQVNLDHTIIRSPIDGVVVSRDVDVGQTIAASFQSPTLFTIADLRRMQLMAEVSEGDVGEVRAGSRVSFVVDSLGPQPIAGTVAEVRLQPVVEQASSATATGGSSSSTPASTGGSGPAGGTSASTSPLTATPPTSTQGTGVVSYMAVVDVDNTDGRLAPGSTAIVTLAGARRQDVTRIPNNALSFRPSAAVLEAIKQDPPILESTESGRRRVDSIGRSAYVWRYDDRQFVPVKVVVGLSDDHWTELLSGDIHPGDLLVTSASTPATASGSSPLNPPPARRR
jgi:HlyD family secretion protein